MPTFGGFGGWPRRFGGGRTRVETIYEALNQARGTAYDTSDDSNVTAETYAHAVALSAVWSHNRRMSLQTDPARMSDFIPRWEKILDIRPPVNASANARRAPIGTKFRALSGQSTLYDVVSALLGDSFIGIEYTPIAQAYQRWPENGFPNDWISNTAHILIRVRFGTGQTKSSLLRLLSTMNALLRQMLPAFTTFDWGMFREDGVSSGFFLDDPLGAGPPPSNLNWETFNP